MGTSMQNALARSGPDSSAKATLQRAMAASGRSGSPSSQNHDRMSAAFSEFRVGRQRRQSSQSSHTGPQELNSGSDDSAPVCSGIALNRLLTGPMATSSQSDADTVVSKDTEAQSE